MGVKEAGKKNKRNIGDNEIIAAKAGGLTLTCHGKK